MKDLINTKEFRNFVMEVKERIYKAQYEALKTVNKELIQLYWDIGKMIVRKQDELGWGEAVVENLAHDLQNEYPGLQGFSQRNLWRMRNFYTEYKSNTIMPPVVAEIGWTHNVIIMDKCKDETERKFYIQSTKKFGWTKDVLIHQVENDSIGIIICRSKNKIIVEYSLSDSTHPFGVATYSTTAQLPANYKKYLPAKKIIEKRLSEFFIKEKEMKI